MASSPESPVHCQHYCTVLVVQSPVSTCQLASLPTCLNIPNSLYSLHHQQWHIFEKKLKLVVLCIVATVRWPSLQGTWSPRGMRSEGSLASWLGNQHGRQLCKGSMWTSSSHRGFIEKEVSWPEVSGLIIPMLIKQIWRSLLTKLLSDNKLT